MQFAVIAYQQTGSAPGAVAVPADIVEAQGAALVAVQRAEKAAADAEAALAGLRRGEPGGVAILDSDGHVVEDEIPVTDGGSF